MSDPAALTYFIWQVLGTISLWVAGFVGGALVSLLLMIKFYNFLLRVLS